MKRVLAFLLTLVLLMSAYPAAMVSASEIEEIPEETSAETLLEMAEEPAVPELSASEFTVIADPGLPDNEELFAAYAQQKLYGSSFSFLGTAAGERLTGDEKLIYDAVLPYLRQIASGERKSTIISFGKTVSYKETTYTPDVEATFTGGALTQESLGRILDALLSDLPYEMYWYAKTIGCKTFLLSSSTMLFAQLKFTVADNYAGSGDYTVDTAKTGAASEVVAKANAIVAKYADKTDYEKLVGYKKEICNLVSYNHNAADTGVYAVDNDPWQLIYVFDGDESTKVVCEGYSKAFMYLCDLSDFRGNTTCYTVTGTMNGGGHMWNIVTLEGKNYLVDVTNSDSGMVGQNGGLFLAGSAGSPTQGYKLIGVEFLYDADELVQWGSGSDSILALAETSYAHDQHDYKAYVTAPTCTAPGYTLYICFCGDSYVGNYVDELGHSFGKWTEVAAPTCTEKGSDRRDCANCDYFETREVAAKGHSHTAVVTAPTCTEKGYTTHTCACGDSFVDTYVDALGHSWDEGTVTTEPTEESAGVRTYTCVGCGATKTEDVPALKHTHKHTTVVTAPTCTEKGYTTHTCPCGDSFVDTYVDALGHSFGDWTEVTAPTCTEKGSQRRDCANCDHFETREVAAKGHSYTAVVTAPTCAAKGYTTHTCACGDSFVDSYVAAKGHSFGEWIEAIAPTCTEKGSDRRDCTNCDVFETREVAEKGHNYQSVVTAPTYTQKGYTTHICLCGENYKDSYANPTGLPKPSVSVSNNSKGKPILTWTDCDEVDYYYVYRATSKTGKKTYIGKTTGGSYTDSKASLGKTYYYFVKAVCSEDSSLSSSYSTYDKAYGKAAAPSVTVSVSTSTGKPTIKWKKVTGAKKYTIYRATSKSGTYKALKSTTSTSYTDTSAKPGTTYYYKVKVNASKGSAYDSIYSSVKSGKCIPAKPAAKIALSKNKPKVSWKKVSGATKYEVYRSTKKSSGFTKIKTVSGTSYVDKTAKKGTTYYYKVVAVKGSAKSAYSNTVKMKSK